MEMKIRAGIGYDVHCLEGGLPLILGGAEIPWERGLAGHSDADVLIHAVIDALLGAAALGDIGMHFPPGDPRFKDISSLLLLGQVAALIKEKGFSVLNIDSTIIAQAPRLAQHIPAMRRNMALVLGLAQDDVSVKATTTEHLGFTGREEGIAACAIALVTTA